MMRSRVRCGTKNVLSAALAFVLVSLIPAEMSAQSTSVPYYGKNQVKYDKFDWHIYTTGGASRTRGELCRERLSANQRRSAA